MMNELVPAPTTYTLAMKYLTKIECTRCNKTYSSEQPLFLCSCGAPLFVRYDLDTIKMHITKNDIKIRPRTMWRYRELLPVTDAKNILTLGEGFTPLVDAPRLGKEAGIDRLLLKDESLNPTGSFKARGQSVAISKAKELGISKICLPTAGNAGGAAAAYGALGGMDVLITMPHTTPETFKAEAAALGARLEMVDGSIADAGEYLKTIIDESWYDVSTLKEPYRVEGKKTMGFELAEQLDWRLPDVIIYPTGGGTGLIGMWKAFDELERMGWISSNRPRMIAVQAEGCAPIVKAYQNGSDHAEEWNNPETVAAGLRVPKAVGGFLMLDIIRKSGGIAVTVTDEELLNGTWTIGTLTGIFSAPEGGAAFAAAQKLTASGYLKHSDTVVLFLTGSGLKYTDTIGKYMYNRIHLRDVVLSS